MLVCGVLLATPNAIFSPGLPLALLAWSITEIIRYSFYGLNLLDVVPGVLIFLRYVATNFSQSKISNSFPRDNSYLIQINFLFRYTTFIILYPTGVSGELLCLYWAQNYAKNNSIWSIELPNAYNFSFSYYIFLWVVIILYIPLFPQLYMHMFALRKKVLGKQREIQGLKTKCN